MKLHYWTMTIASGETTTITTEDGTSITTLPDIHMKIESMEWPESDGRRMPIEHMLFRALRLGAVDFVVPLKACAAKAGVTYDPEACLRVVFEFMKSGDAVSR